tara:strand:- start:65440 stop:66798 length:1359 start_codon:yes stop_codon:yes gene_type:complete
MKKLLIANRGEIACRVIESAKKLGINTVAIYSEADKDSKHANLADEAIFVGPSNSKDSYLKIDNILSAANKTGADAIHPGYGFLAENPGFAKEVIESGITWVGPSSENILAMGDKESARRTAKQAGVPILEGSQRFNIGQNNGLEETAEKIGFPLLVKASSGGGGIGMRRVNSAQELMNVVESTQNMAEKSFGDGSIYLEKLIEKPRHVEIQVFGLENNECLHFFERECSIQRRFQKIIEESPSPAINNKLRESMTSSAIALARQQGYLGAGTVEFLLSPEGEFYFLEMNTRIQVEHPVTEMVTNSDLVEYQLKLANKEAPKFSLQQDDIILSGHSIECRIYAENPLKNFMPSPGTLKTFSPPDQSPSIRVDTGYREKDEVTFYYDPMIAKLSTHGENREESIKKMLRALNTFCIEGIDTNIDFLIRVIGHKDFKAGNTHTDFIEIHKKDII